MKDLDRIRALAALAAVELNMAELRDLPGWWEHLSSENRHRWLEEISHVRSLQHDVQNANPLAAPLKG
jgi:hypothetical protein